MLKNIETKIINTYQAEFDDQYERACVDDLLAKYSDLKKRNWHRYWYERILLLIKNADEFVFVLQKSI
ncbi:hypothetical protein FACS189413_12320 [Bacteroidia bacterium]|nr:hypothetical protein FACS189413_12320 [Bacteroidia bacterium]